MKTCSIAMLLLLSACPAATQPTPVTATTTVTEPTPTPVEPTVSPVYGPGEAIADVLAAPLEHMDTGPWPGIMRYQACAYRNDRVIVVDVFCSKNEPNAVRLDVFSPERGRVRISAEADAPITTITRADYSDWMIESEPATTDLGFRLDMSADELRAYDKRRYDQIQPVCYRTLRPSGGTTPGDAVCQSKRKHLEGEWAAQSQAFWDSPPEQWYTLLKDLRHQAMDHGKPPRR